MNKITGNIFLYGWRGSSSLMRHPKSPYFS